MQYDRKDALYRLNINAGGVMDRALATRFNQVPGFSLFSDVIKEQSVTQGSIGRDTSRYPPRSLGLYKVEFAV